MPRPARHPSSVRLPSSPPSALIVLLLSLLAAGVLLWVFLLPRAERSVFDRVPILDEVYYLDRAAELDGRLCPPEPCFMSPLYPQLIRLAGSDAPVPADRVVPAPQLRRLRLLQVACWLGTVLLLALIGWRDLAPPDASVRRRVTAAALPALLFFLYLPGAAYATSVLVEMPLAFLVTAAFALLPGAGRRDPPRPHRLLALGVVLGMAGLLRGTALAALPAVAGVLALRAHRRNWRIRPALVLPAAGAILVLMIPVVHNSRLAGRPSPPTLNAGVNLYIGNGPDANGFYVASIPGEWRSDPAGRGFLAERLGRNAVSLATADSVWSAWARDSVKESPGRAAGLWAKKVWLHLQAWEIDQLLPLDAWSAQIPAAPALFVSYGLLVALGLGWGLVGLVRRPDSPSAGWMLALMLVIGLQSVFFVVSRYRLVLVPLWALLAAGAVVDRRGGWRLRSLLVVCGLLVTVPWGLGGVRDLWAAMARANEGRRWALIGEAENVPADLERARTLFRQALAGGAPGPVPWRALVAVDRALDDVPAAAKDLARGLVAFPRDEDLLKQKAADLLAARRPDLALPVLQRILAEDPRDADSLHNLAVLQAGRGEMASAEDVASALVHYHPADPRGYVDLGVIQVRQGRHDEARATFRRGLDMVPGNEALTRNLRILEDRKSP